MAYQWHPIKKLENGRIDVLGIQFGSGDAGLLDLIKENDKYIILKSRGYTTYIPRQMVYAEPSLYLLRRLDMRADGYQETERIKDMDYNRQNKKQVFTEMIALFDKLSGTLNEKKDEKLIRKASDTGI